MVRSAGLITLLSLTWAGTALAQDAGGFDAHGFDMGPLDDDPRDLLTLSRAGRFSSGSWYAGGLFEYASQPLIFEPTENERVIALDNVLGANLGAGFAPHERVRLDLALPVFFASQGTDGAQGASVGDVRVGGLVALVRPSEIEGGLGLGLIGHLGLPTGAADKFLGASGLFGDIAVNATWEGEAATLTGQVGSAFRANTQVDTRPAPTQGGDALTWGVGAGYLVNEFTGVNLEVHGEVAYDDVVRTAVGTPAEALVSVRYANASGGHFAAGIGTGLSRGAGAAPIRLVVGGGFGKFEQRIVDTDGDGLLDNEDACIDQPENVNGYKDSDGCPDTLPTVHIKVLDEAGKPTDVAELVVLDSMGAPVPYDADGLLQYPKTFPGSVFVARAKLGECLSGEATVTVQDGDNIGEVALLPKYASTISVTVKDAEGKLLPAAKIEYRTQDPSCVPPGQQLEGGKGEHKLGPGNYNIFITADDYSVYRTKLALDSKQAAKLEVVLKPTKVKVEKKAIKILDKVYFENNSAKIDPRSFDLLTEVADTIVANGIAKVQVEGHTDNKGKADYNKQLSQERADAVRAFLIEKGVPATSLVAIGFGQERPMADNKTSTGRAENRRGEFNLPDEPTTEAAPPATAPAAVPASGTRPAQE